MSETKELNGAPCKLSDYGYSCFVEECPCDTCILKRIFREHERDLSKRILDTNGRW